MEFLNKISTFIQDLEEREFYKYLWIFLGILMLTISFMIFRYYRNTSYYVDVIEEINIQRSDQVRDVLKRFEIIKIQRQEIDELLKKEEDFKISGYFEDLLKSLNISAKEKKATQNVTTKEISEKYRKSELATQLVGINMKQLCELLEELEGKKRINIKNLEIKKSNKTLRAIDVDLTISTLLPKI